MGEKREDSRLQNDELWDKKFTDNEDLDSTGHLSRTERRKQKSHSSTVTTVLIVLIIVLAATPLIYWINNKQSFNHPVRTEQTASVSSKKKHSHRVSSASHKQSTKRASSEVSSSSQPSYSSQSSSVSAYSNNRTPNRFQQSSYNRQTANSHYSTVQRGDSLARVAARNGMTVQELARLNNMSVNSPIHPGQQIRVR